MNFRLCLFIFLSIFLLNSCRDKRPENKTTKVVDDTNYTYIHSEPKTTTNQNELFKTSKSAFEYLNALRVGVGLDALSWSKELNISSINHSKYVSYHNKVSHQEIIGEPYFTGEWASNRATYAGFSYKGVSENIATAKNEIVSIDNLFSAIYHRFGFLDFDIDIVGMGKAVFDKNYVYIYNMSNDKIAKLCKEDFSQSVNYYQNICADENKNIDAKTYDNLLKSIRLKKPDFVTFPASGMIDVLPVFYSEIPDPLPEYYMSANPISINFNPIFGENNVTVFNFSIRPKGKEELDVIELNATNDPNNKLSSNEFAFFPEKRLDYNTLYLVSFSYKIGDGEIKSYDFNFTTRNYENLIKVTKNNEAFSLDNAKTYHLYFDTPLHMAKNQNSETKNYSISKTASLKSDIDIIDSMTFSIKLDGASGDRMEFYNLALGSDYKVILKIK